MSRRPEGRRPSFGDVTRPWPLYLPVSFLVLTLVVTAAIGILLIGARSPYTHGNLATGYDARYDRTEQITVGPGEAYVGISAPAPRTGNAVADGERLFVTKGCAACHTAQARGGVVGPPVVGTDEATVQKKVRRGPGGMPHYSNETLTDDEAAAIAAYLRSLVMPESQ